MCPIRPTARLSVVLRGCSAVLQGKAMTLAREIVPTAINRHGITTDTRWLSIREIAADLGVSSSTAYKWSARGAPWFPRSSAFATATSASGGTGTRRGLASWSSDGEGSVGLQAEIHNIDAHTHRVSCGGHER